jgi:hypothetical protein
MGGKPYRANALVAMAILTMQTTTGSAINAPNTKKWKNVNNGTINIAGEVLFIQDINLQGGRINFTARGVVTNNHPPGDLRGVEVFGKDEMIILYDIEFVMSLPHGAIPGDTLTVDFQLDPKVAARTERWVLLNG